jgi:hypothetical protein
MVKVSQSVNDTVIRSMIGFDLLSQSLSFAREDNFRRPGGQCGFPIFDHKGVLGNAEPIESI